MAEQQELPAELQLELQELQAAFTKASTELESQIRSAAPEDNKSNTTPPSTANQFNRSSLKAAALGGFFSIVQDVTTSSQKPATTTSVWGRALQAAEKSMDSHNQQRAFSSEDVTIDYLVGDIHAKNIGLVIHGFMTAEETNVAHLWEEWSKSLDMILYRIHWPTGTLECWEEFWNKTSDGQQQQQQWFSQLTNNPWHVAQDKTEQVGRVLARFLESQKQSNRNTILIGHSLGGAIVYQTLLQASGESIVDHAIVLAGAFLPQQDEIVKFLPKINGILVNAYSKNDTILQTAFRAANFNVAQAAGNVPIGMISAVDVRHQILDLDMTEYVPVDETTHFGHSYTDDVLQVLASKIKDLIV